MNYRATLVWAAAAALSLSTACSDSSLEPLRARPGLRPSLDVSSSLFFSDALTGPTSPNLSIPLTKYSYTADGLARTYVDPTINPTGNEIDDRELVRTLSSAYFTTDFTASITVDIRGAKDISYFGFGVGNMDPNYYNEAAHNFLFRIHKWGGYFGIQAAAEGNGGIFLDDHEIGNYPGGPVTFVFTRVGNSLTMSVPSIGAQWTYSISQFAPAMGLNSSNTQLYFGNTYEGTVFSNFSVTPGANTGTPPSISSVTPSVTTIWPPNGKMVPVTIAAQATGTPAPVCAIASVSSNEPGANQWAITGALSVDLRAERLGSGTGRVYSIVVTCTNSAGSASQTTTVSVPHDQR